MPDRRYGARVRGLRRRAGLTQAALAGQLGVSASYLNLIENDRRPLTTELLLRLAQVFDLDLRSFARDDEAHLVSDLSEVFADAVFEDHPLTRRDITELVASAPQVARAVMRMHEAYVAARGTAEALAQRELENQDVASSADRARLSSEQVSDMLHGHGNHFPGLEAAAESLWRDAGLEQGDLYRGLLRHFETVHGGRARIAQASEIGGAVRRYDPRTRVLLLAEGLRGWSRTFQLATQIGLLECRAEADRILGEAQLSGEAVALGRVALASYFAGAVVMPYERFLRAADETRHDVELLGQRFDAGFEQTCHRLTTLRRPGREGIPFYFMRVDMAGNISKKFSAAGIRFPRFSGLCALWNVHAAFLQPGTIRVQISRQVDGTTVFAIARTLRRRGGAHGSAAAMYSVGIGCDISHAHRLVYSDGMDLANPALAVPIGITCRLCERTDCAARAVPSVHHPLRIDENVRGISFFAATGELGGVGGVGEVGRPVR